MSYSLKRGENINVISLDEANSGWLDHKSFKKTLGDIFEKAKKLFNNKSNVKFNELTTLDKHFFYIIEFYNYRGDPSEPRSTTRAKLRVSFVDQKPEKRTENIVFLGAGAYVNDGEYEIEFAVNTNMIVSEVLKSFDKLEEYLSHELVHIFKKLHGSYQKTRADYIKNAKGSESGEMFDQFYWTNKHEIQAYITQINTQLKNIKKQELDIKYKDAILKTDGFKQFKIFLKGQRPDIIKDVVKKTSHYWVNNLGGKINEGRSKLK